MTKQVNGNEEEYTEYVKCVSGSRITMLSLLSGFTFSAITVLLFYRSDSSSLLSQITFFLLVVLFDLCLFLLAWQTIIVIGTWNVSKAPERSKWELSVFNFLLIFVFILWGWSVVLMFLLRNLDFLALISGIIWAIVIVTELAVLRGMVKRLGWSVKEEFKNIRSKK
ncbi:MAG: hypothetical protein JSV67_04205 [Thermoplasmatales archaeon]|nr:MAG: hypothetical protein JSV67_04205 [Thermoplasmatales archaeon]